VQLQIVDMPWPADAREVVCNHVGKIIAHHLVIITATNQGDTAATISP